MKSCKAGTADERYLTHHVFLDRSAVELYINDGLALMTVFDFPERTGAEIRFYVKDGAAAIDRPDFWILASG
ncbi:hypothetical protein GCM10010916_47280 [Paenibacillus abyssi]|uniref:Glycosyl hydrolase family 32 C-terminal domain-containing protein n=1 Tax=Paenibacillus abyssi TaxID=1340531 RepID=A0A917G710_9BACL|nr:hypothetical protein GCM10010916_47280 [Paenibacillus abyssi]